MEGLADDDVPFDDRDWDMPSPPQEETELASLLPIFVGDEDLEGVPLSVAGVVLAARAMGQALLVRERERELTPAEKRVLELWRA